MANLFDIGDLVEIRTFYNERCTAQIQAILINKRTENYYYGFFKETVDGVCNEAESPRALSLEDLTLLPKYHLIKEVVFDKHEKIIWFPEYELTMIKERNQIPVILYQIRKEIGI